MKYWPDINAICTQSNVVAGLGRPVEAAQPAGSAIPGLSGHHVVPPSVVLKIPCPRNPANSVVLLCGSISRSVGLAPVLPAAESFCQRPALDAELLVPD